jgi:DNA-binding transcriptional ArsR family regulator
MSTRRPVRHATTARRTPTPELLGLVAERFRALGEPARLGILHALEEGPKSVTALAAHTGLGQANLSKHLQQLHAAGFVSRTRRGMFVDYALADERVLHLCELMCGRLDNDLAAARAAVAPHRRSA